jgi:hypothetical protein
MDKIEEERSSRLNSDQARTDQVKPLEGVEDKAGLSRWFAPGLTALAGLLRVAPHPWNFTPIGSMALFGGARLSGWQAWCIPIAAMAITDPIVSWMAGYPAYSSMTVVVYACLLINVFLGRTLLRTSQSLPRLASVSILASTIFYLVTNFFCWLGVPAVMYPMTTAGLVECYTSAMPFFGRTLLGDLFYAGILFTVHAALTRQAVKGFAARS